jgi:hypothetical protein
LNPKHIFLFLLALCLPLLAQQPGDINNDGKIDSTDIARGVRMALGKPPSPTPNEILAGDMNRDGKVTVQDLVFISNTIAGRNRPPVADASASPDSGSTGTNIQLNATRSFDLDGNALTYRWRQLHMTRFSTEYLTENEAVLSDSTSATPTFNPQWPGNYRFELRAAETTGLDGKDTIEVFVRQAGRRELQVKGIYFNDLFGEFGGPAFDMLPDDPDSQRAVLGRAMEVAVRVNAKWIGIVPSAWFARINPLPKISPANNNTSLTSESDYAAIVAAAKARGLKVIHQEQLNLGELPLRPGEFDSLEILKNSSVAWWDQWFIEWKNYILPRADWAQRYGVDALEIFQFADVFAFQPAVYPQYGERWREIIAAVRARYSGLVVLNVIHPDQLNFADALDALSITVFPGLYTSSGRIQDVRNPTPAELRAITESFFDAHESVVGNKVPVHYWFNATSSDGQAYNFNYVPPSEVDRQEQVIYYEAFLQALADETWVTGFSSWYWSWFKEFDLPGLHFDEFTTTSVRGKPAEQVVKLWYGFY